MRITTFFATFAAIGLQVAAAVPHGHGGHQHAKKDLTTVKIIETEWVTASPTDPAIVVWVDIEGNVVSTETRIDLGSDPTIAPETTSSTAETTTESVFTAPPNNPAAAPPTLSSVAPPAPTSFTTPLAPTTTEAAPAPATTSAEPSLEAAPSGGSSKVGNNGGTIVFGLGIAYDLLNNAGACKSASTVEDDFNNWNFYGTVRIYNTDCNAVQLVTTQAAQRGMKVIAGIDNSVISSGQVAADIANLIGQAGSNLGVIGTIAVGNEYVSSGAGPASAAVAAVGAARAALAGKYGGSIVTVDNFGTLESTPALCSASDYCAANIHAYFTEQITPEGAGAYVQQMVEQVAAANPGKEVVVTESGWPWNTNTGPTDRANEATQVAAIASLRNAFSSDLVLFQGYDTKYKTGSDPAEGYWGIYYHENK